jgi:hypothetical protein
VRQVRPLSIREITARIVRESLSGASQRQPSRRSCGTLGVGPVKSRLHPRRRPSFSTNVHEYLVGLAGEPEASHEAEFA